MDRCFLQPGALLRCFFPAVCCCSRISYCFLVFSRSLIPFMPDECDVRSWSTASACCCHCFQRVPCPQDKKISSPFSASALAGKAEATTFDHCVIEMLVDSLVHHGKADASAPLSELLQFTLCTVLWRYLDRTDQQRCLGSERTQVNAMRFLEVCPQSCHEHACMILIYAPCFCHSNLSIASTVQKTIGVRRPYSCRRCCCARG